ncbi:unnamed protein product [Durusdinium trenchii]|uniref:Uncharacterized protein n=1 Tax=Durusdinium trenchii TaxID=1381693 RepID=A0ABP0K0P9_9DINO
MISESGTRRVGRLSLLATAMGCIQLCCFAQIGLRAQQTSLQEKKVSDLKELLRSKGLKVSGRKKELVERLLASAEEPVAKKPKKPSGARSDNAAVEVSFEETDLNTWIALRSALALAFQDPEQGDPKLFQEAKDKLASYTADFPEIFGSLRDQQRDSVLQGLLRRGRCLIADEMGLGKTFTSLVLAQIYAEEWPLLIVAPTSVLDNWVKEVTKWLPHIASEVEILDSRFLKEKYLMEKWERKLIFVASYDQIRLKPALARQSDGAPYKVVILDEAHKMKDPHSQRSQALLPVCRAANRCILLTGTPVLNAAYEIWTPMAALDVNIPPFDQFCRRYSDFNYVQEQDGSVTKKLIGARNIEELHGIFASYMVRKKKEEVLPDLAKIRKRKENLRDKIDTKYVKNIMGILKRKAVFHHQVAKIFSQTAKAKAAPATDFVERLLMKETDAKLVVFGHHYVLFDQMEKMLKRLQKKYIRLDGRVAKPLRQGLIDKFQEDEEVEVAIVAMKACGQGISLTAARTVVFAELLWTPAILEQAEARVHRHGLKHDVDIIYCVLEGKPFMDDAVIRKIKDKEILADRITDGQELESSRFECVQSASVEWE